MTGFKLNFLNLNIQSLRRHYDDLLLFLNERKFKFQIIILTEIWVYSDEVIRYNIPGYKLEAQCRDGQRLCAVLLSIY